MTSSFFHRSYQLLLTSSFLHSSYQTPIDLKFLPQELPTPTDLAFPPQQLSTPTDLKFPQQPQSLYDTENVVPEYSEVSEDLMLLFHNIQNQDQVGEFSGNAETWNPTPGVPKDVKSTEASLILSSPQGSTDIMPAFQEPLFALPMVNKKCQTEEVSYQSQESQTKNVSHQSQESQTHGIEVSDKESQTHHIVVTYTTEDKRIDPADTMRKSFQSLCHNATSKLPSDFDECPIFKCDSDDTDAYSDPVSIGCFGELLH